MGKNEAIEEIKKKYLEEYKKINKKDERISFFKNLIKKSEENNLVAYAECFRGYMEWIEDNFEKAIEHFRKSIELDEHFAYPLNGLGNVYWKKKEYDTAIEYYKKAIQLDDSFAYPWNGLGNVYIKKKEYDTAIEYYKKAIQLDNSFAYPLNGLGNVYSEKEEYDKAIEYYQRAIQIDDNFASPWNGLGHIYWKKKEYDKAIESFQRAIQIDDSFAAPWNGLGNVYGEKKEYDKAIEYFQRAIQIDDSFAAPWNGLGNVYVEKIEYDTAIESFQRAIQIDDSYPAPWNGLGNVYWKKKEYDTAIESFQRAIQLDNSFAYPLNGLGNIYGEKNEYDNAIESFQRAIQIDDSYPAPWNGLGNVYWKKKEYDKAIESFQRAIQIDDSFAVPRNGLGIVYKEKKEYDKAIEYFKRSIELDEHSAYPWYNLALVHVQLKRYEEAESCYKKFLELAEIKKDHYGISIAYQKLKEVQQLLQSQKALKKKRALKHPDTATKVLNATIDQGIEDKALENKKSFLSFIDEKSDGKDEEKDYFKVLRRWNSYTPIIADNYHISKGGGYFLKVDGKGIVIDPGFNFIDNFKGAGHFFDEIDTVLVSHAHNDHTADLESILTLLYKYNKEIKDSTDSQKENTIRKEIAQRRNCDINAVTSDDIEKEFLQSPRRKIIDFYMTNSVFKKFSGLFELSSTKNYRIHCIEEGEVKKLNNSASFEVIAAKHRDIISDTDSVGFIISTGDTALIYSGDTGWSEKIEENYKRVIKDYNDKYKLLVAHLGGFKETEINYMNENADREKVFYPNHLGRLGLVRINEIVKPKICFISEFGEELKGYRIKIAKIYQEAFDNKIIFFPADIGLTFNLKSKMVEAVTKVNLKEYELSKAEVKPGEIEPCLLRKDYSLHYFKKDGGFTESELTQVLDKKYDNSNR